jgi:hypothetical protein
MDHSCIQRETLFHAQEKRKEKKNQRTNSTRGMLCSITHNRGILPDLCTDPSPPFSLNSSREDVDDLEEKKSCPCGRTTIRGDTFM